MRLLFTLSCGDEETVALDEDSGSARGAGIWATVGSNMELLHESAGPRLRGERLLAGAGSDTCLRCSDWVDVAACNTPMGLLSKFVLLSW